MLHRITALPLALLLWLPTITQAATADPTSAATAPAPVETPAASAGREPFAANCGFCHGRDASGGSTGPDLTHSEAVTQSADASALLPLLRNGRPDKGMPGFAQLSADELNNIIAFVQFQTAVAASANGQRRAVDASDLLVGNARRGKIYFDKNCGSCHSASGDLAGIGSRMTGLPLLRRMLYPGSEGRTNPRKPATVVVTLASGEQVRGDLAYRDEFVVGVKTADGRYQSWAVPQVNIVVSDPVEAHVEQLARYTDADMHNVYAYLQSLL